MKKIFFFLSTIALLGLASACVEQISTDNPNYNAEKGEVKTEFVINIATNAQTKATAAEVQATTVTTDDTGTNISYGTFRGMQDIQLFMTKGYGTSYLTNYIYNLADFAPVTIFGAQNLTQEGAIDKNNSRRVYNMNIPIGVDNMVFYAKAKTTSSTSSNNKTNFTVTSNKNTTKFELVPITTDETVFTTNNTSATAILAILNAFKNTAATETAPATTIASDWFNSNDVELKTAYEHYFTTSEVLRQGSGPAVLRTMEDLYKIVLNRTDDLSVAIKGALDHYFTATTTNTGTTANPIYSLTKLEYNPDNIDLLDFPLADLGLPEGAAQVTCTGATDGNPVFAWVEPSKATSLMGTAESLDYKDLVYPAELCYWADSPIRISNTEGVEGDETYYPKTWSAWNTSDSWNSHGWLDWSTPANRVVTSRTRAVALKNNVLYGTALAATTVRLSSATLPDNRAALVQGLENKSISVDNKFEVTGILIGGQPKTVGWNFVDESSTARKSVIYDHSFGDHAAVTTNANTTNPFYTMVFDNYIKRASNDGNQAQDVVVIALELKNNAEDFYGKDNIIYKGGKFYLMGTLNLNAVATTTNPNPVNTDDLEDELDKLAGLGYRIPPVDPTTATMVSTPRIFVQDFTTTINLTLGANALKNAYATIPDLRKIQMYFGLSVDLEWKTGTTLNVEL